MSIRRVACLSLCACIAALPAERPDADFFELKVRPVLVKNCLACHSNVRSGGLAMDSRDALLKGGNDGPAILPGEPENSLLITAVRQTHPRFKMPPAPQKKLSDGEIADLVEWIKEGAAWPEGNTPTSVKSGPEYVISPEQRAFWSFQPVRKPTIPEVRNESWVRGPVDRFILARLEANRLTPAPRADKRTLIRRVTYDLTGLPPTLEEIESFVHDSSAGSFTKVVDRLLASPHYGERWGRHWLDLARYADDRLMYVNTGDKPLPTLNAWRYRDWVVQAFNNDMPYDRFIKAQLAADLMPAEDRDNLLPGLGFHGLKPLPDVDDYVDVSTKVFLGLTVGCAKCHDHKYDPIPTKDYYSLQGIFDSSEYHEYPLAAPEVVKRWQDQQKRTAALKTDIQEFVEKQQEQLGEILVHKTTRYMIGAWKVIAGAVPDEHTIAEAEQLDSETLQRWVRYLRDPAKEHPYLKPWFAMISRPNTLDEVRKLAEEYQELAVATMAQKRAIDDRNYVILGGADGAKDPSKRLHANLEFLPLDKYYLWRDLAGGPAPGIVAFKGGIYYFPENQIGRFLGTEWKSRLETMRAELGALDQSLPAQYPLLHGIGDAPDPHNVRVAIRGERSNPGEEAPRRFLAILCGGTPALYTKGSGRLDLADAIATAQNPLTARVMVNRIWQHHFGQGIVRTSSNFGQLGDRPTHPELLDYLATRLVDAHWSIKAIHREILLSATYSMSTETSPLALEKDPSNRLLSHANAISRLDAEELRDSLLAVTGNLDLTVGGPSLVLDEQNRRRTLYARITRATPDSTMALFDFPDPNMSSDQRLVTNGPLQQLYFLNSKFVRQQAEILVEKVRRESGTNDAERVRKAYQIVFKRIPDPRELRLGLEFLRPGIDAWPQYTQVLLSSSEFTSVN